MQNEELTKELNALQEKFNKEIEDFKDKLTTKKEKTLDEIGEDLKHGTSAYIKTYLTANKEEIINALNK